MVSHQIPLLRLGRRRWCRVLLTGAQGTTWTKYFLPETVQAALVKPVLTPGPDRNLICSALRSGGVSPETSVRDKEEDQELTTAVGRGSTSLTWSFSNLMQHLNEMPPFKNHFVFLICADSWSWCSTLFRAGLLCYAALQIDLPSKDKRC